jgi:hypothetical protein
MGKCAGKTGEGQMAEKMLTDRKCKAALGKARDKVTYLNDGKGLRLQIRPDGAAYWMLRYRHGGKGSTHGLGTYPATTIAQAREKAAQARSVIELGLQPHDGVPRARSGQRGARESHLPSQIGGMACPEQADMERAPLRA